MDKTWLEKSSWGKNFLQTILIFINYNLQQLHLQQYKLQYIFLSVVNMQFKWFVLPLIQLIETYHGRCTSDILIGDVFYLNDVVCWDAFRYNLTQTYTVQSSLVITHAICRHTSHMIAENPFGQITLVTIYPSIIVITYFSHRR